MKFTFKEIDLIYQLVRDEASNAERQLDWYKDSEDTEPEKLEAQRRAKFANDLMAKIETTII